MINVTVAECPMNIKVGTYGDSNRKSLTLAFPGGYELAEITIDPCNHDGDFYEDIKPDTREKIHSGDLVVINTKGENTGMLQLLIHEGVVEKIVDMMGIARLGANDSSKPIDFPVVRLAA